MQWSGNSICFFFFSLSSFCWKCAELYEVIHLYPNRNIGFAILDQTIGPSMLYSHCLWHQIIYEALEESKLQSHPHSTHKEASQLCSKIYGVKVVAAWNGTRWKGYGFKHALMGKKLHHLRNNLGLSYL